MNRAGLKVYYRTRRARAIQRRFPPLQRAQIVQLACLEPIAKGLHITHWTSQDLARQAVAEGIVEVGDAAEHVGALFNRSVAERRLDDLADFRAR